MAQYVDFAQFKASIGEQAQDRDDLIRATLAAVDTAIEDYCQQRFTLAEAPITLTYVATDGREGATLDVDPIGSLTGLAVEVGQGMTFLPRAADTYEAHPLNAIARGLPVTTLESLTGRWPIGRSRIRVTARFGWPVVPAPVTMAALLWATRLWARRGSPEGVVGSPDFGSVRVPRVDPDVAAQLAPYRDRVGGQQ